MPTKNPAALPDIIVDMIQRIEPLLANPPAAQALPQTLANLEKQLRADWGGDRAYIPHRRGGTDNTLHSERNSRIWRAYQQGRHIAWMARQELLSERQVVRILTSLRSGRKPNDAR